MHMDAQCLVQTECSMSCSDCNGISCLNHKTVDVDNGVDTDDMDQ